MIRSKKRALEHAKAVLRAQIHSAKKHGYTPPDISPEGLATLIQTSKQCSLCGKRLQWSGYRPAALHHNHLTCRVIGFVHHGCNQIEGSGKTEQAETFRYNTYIDPTVSDTTIGGVWANGVLRGQRVSKK